MESKYKLNPVCVSRLHFLCFMLLQWTTCVFFLMESRYKLNPVCVNSLHFLCVRLFFFLWLLSHLILFIESHYSWFIFLVILGNSFASRVISRGSRPTNTACTIPGGQRGPGQALLQVITVRPISRLLLADWTLGSKWLCALQLSFFRLESRFHHHPSLSRILNVLLE